MHAGDWAVLIEKVSSHGSLKKNASKQSNARKTVDQTSSYVTVTRVESENENRRPSRTFRLNVTITNVNK